MDDAGQITMYVYSDLTFKILQSTAKSATKILIPSSGGSRHSHLILVPARFHITHLRFTSLNITQATSKLLSHSPTKRKSINMSEARMRRVQKEIRGE